MSEKKPPFIQGKEAFLAGKPLTDNPYPEGIAHGDEYPGPHNLWRDGWTFEKKIKEFK